MLRDSGNRKLCRAVCAAVMVGLFILVSSSLAGINYTGWEDFGVVYTPEDGDAYYPSVIFDGNGFGEGSRPFKMWYSDGSGGVYLVESDDGHIWSEPVENEGLIGSPYHVQVIYDAGGFGDSTGPRYKIWYWNIDGGVYTFDAFGTAESDDGYRWKDRTDSLFQDDDRKLVGDAAGNWNSGTYGPVSIIYQPDAPNDGNSPFDYSYVLFYDATDGQSEVTGLAYSVDGLKWIRYGDEAVLSGGPPSSWDCSDAVYGTVFMDDAGYHYWYSGGGGDDGQGGCKPGRVHEGIGYAYSVDGINWKRGGGNPIFHIDDGVPHRNERGYTPAVVKDDEGDLYMFYSAKAEGGKKKIALAKLFPTVHVRIDIRPGFILLPGKYRWWRSVRAAILSSPAFDATRQVDRDTLSFGRTGYEDSLRRCFRRPRDVNRDGLDDLVCVFRRHDTGFQCGDRVGYLRGMTVDGYHLEGTDAVRIFACRRWR